MPDYSVNMKSLHRAILENDLDSVELLINQGTDVNCLDSLGRSPLYIAARMRNLPISKLLLIGGAKIEITDTVNELLYSAINSNNSDLVKLLLRDGVNPNVVPFGRSNNCFCVSTPLQLAVQNGREDLAKILIDHGADINMKVRVSPSNELLLNNQYDQTPLYLAVTNGYLGTVKLLLKSGADVEVKNHKNRTALHAAMCMGNAELSDIGISNRNDEIEIKLEIIELLIKYGSEVNIQDVDGNSPLHLAVKNQCATFPFSTEKCSLALFELLLGVGASVNVQDKNGNAPLHFVVSTTYPEITDLLLKYTADPNIEDKWGDTPLHKACRHQCEENILMLLNKKGNPTICNKAGRTALIEAIDGCSETIISTVLKFGGNTSIQDQHGDTALHYAVINSNERIESKTTILNLLKYGSDPNSQNKMGDTPLHKACEKSSKDIILIILEYGGKPNIQNRNGFTAFHIAVESFVDIFESGILSAILKRGGDPNIKNKQGNTPLHKACVSESQKCIRLILDNGGNPNIQNEYGKTPLHDAIESGNCCEAIIPLLENRGNPNICDENGNTCLHLACKMLCEDCVFAILNNGGNPNLKNCKGDTPMHNLLDISDNSNRLIFALIDHGGDFNIRNKKGYSLIINHRNRTVISRIFVLRDCANLYVYPEVLRAINSLENLKELHVILKKEVKDLKSETVGDTNVTYYFILKETSKNLVKILRNKNIVDVMETEEYMIKFPHYGSMINWYYEQALRRKELTEHILKMSNVIFTDVPYLPFNCIEHILSFLADVELRKLLSCCKFPT